jgi:uncharacterized OB-fold protein
MENKNSREKIKALECNTCRKLYFPPKYHCSQCDKSDFSEINLEGEGKVYSFTVIRMPFEEFVEEAPYTFAEVALDEGLVVPGRFTNEDEKDIKINARVSFVRYDSGVNWFKIR